MKNTLFLALKRASIFSLFVLASPRVWSQGTLQYLHIDFENFADYTEIREQFAEYGLHFDGGVVLPGISAGDGGSLKMDGLDGPKFLFLDKPLTVRCDYDMFGISINMAVPRSREFVYQKDSYYSVHWDNGGIWHFAGSGNHGGPLFQQEFNAYTVAGGLTQQSDFGIDGMNFALVVPEPSWIPLFAIGLTMFACKTRWLLKPLFLPKIVLYPDRNPNSRVS